MSAVNISEYIEQQQNKDQLRFITCGSVDDGKSTLLGRLLYDSKKIFSDQLSNTETESRTYGTQGDAIDLALLVDGLQAEREQGITIDVAYRFFETDKRKFIAADTPGHEQYTRNMATGASTADLAIILIDASKGVITQTRRHSYIVSLLGIKQVIVAVNKMDLVDFEQSAFDAIAKDYRELADQLQISQIDCVAMSALKGDNVLHQSNLMPWYSEAGGSTLMALLENANINSEQAQAPFRMPVQWVNRPNAAFRGYSGLIAGGTVAVGDKVMSNNTSHSAIVTEILSPQGSVKSAKYGQSITLSLSDEIDISRGDMLTRHDQPCHYSDQFAAHIIWMDEEDMLPERAYILRLGSASVSAQVTDLTHRIDINSFEQLAAKTLELNEIGYVKIALDHPIAFDDYAQCRDSGAFVLIDKYSNNTVCAGVIDFELRRATNIRWHDLQIDKAMRARINRQKPCILWFTGLSGAGKSTIADLLEQRLCQMGHRTYTLDGDNVRHGLNKDLGFTDQDRVENIRRVAEVAQLMVDAGLLVLVSFISPFRSERQMARELVEQDEFIEVFVDTPLKVCEQRDPKGLYKKARSGQLKNFTGIESEYQSPENPEIHLLSGEQSVEQLCDQIVDYLKANNSI